MGLFSTKTKTTQTPNIPGYIEGPMKDAFGRVTELGQADPTSFVAPVQYSETFANDLAQKRGLAGGGLFDEAASGIRSVMGSGGGGAGSGTWSAFDKFMNPYTEEVLNTGLERLNREGDRTITGAQLASAGPGLGSNAAVLEALTRGEVEAGKRDFTSSTLFGAADRAAGFADKQADRDQQVNLFNAQLAQQEKMQQLAAAQALAGVGATQGASERADIGTLLDTGGTIRSVDQSLRSSPIDLATAQGQIFNLFNPQMAVGQTTTAKQSGGIASTLLGGLGSLAMGAGGLGFKPFG